MPQFAAAHTVAAFFGAGAEPDTRPLLHAVLAAGKRLCLPVCGSKERQMHMAAVTGLESLVPGPFGIPAPGREAFPVSPQELGLCLVPCVAADTAAGALATARAITTPFCPC